MPNCSQCGFDLPNLLTGSKICNACKENYVLYKHEMCTFCGDGLVQGAEICDAGSLNGCLSNCSGAADHFTCT